jgi:hypothetical protein
MAEAEQAELLCPVFWIGQPFCSKCEKLRFCPARLLSNVPEPLPLRPCDVDSGEVDLRWRLIAQALMEPLVIVKCKVAFKTGEQRRHRYVSIRR